MGEVSFVLHAPLKSEESFVYASWIRSSAAFVPTKVYRPNGGPLTTKWMHGRTWTDILGKRVERLMAKVDVAELEGSLIGFICAEPPVLHYVYVEPKFRRHGTATEMLRRVGMSRHTPCQITHWTPFADLFLVKAEWDERPLE